MTDLYGKSAATLAGDEEYTSPEEYADQGDKRVVSNLIFSYQAATEDASGNVSLHTVDVPRDSEVTVDQIGKLALMNGEKDHAFYTSEELDKKNNPGAGNAPAGELNVSEAGEHELAEWLKNEQPTVNEVLQRVGSDKDLANRMLAAENIATDGDPRKGVETGLTAIIEGSE